MNKPVYMASLRRWLTNPGIVIGVVILSLVVAVAVAAPWLYTIDPNAMDPSNSLQAPGVRAEFITLGGDSFNRLFVMGMHQRLGVNLLLDRMGQFTAEALQVKAVLDLGENQYKFIK